MCGELEIGLISRVSKKFRDIIRDDVRHKYRCILHQYDMQLCIDIIRTNGQDLDIIQRENGQYVFFVIDCDEHSGHTIIDIDNIIYSEPWKFADFIKSQNIDLTEVRDIFNPDAKNFSKLINHKTLVREFRMHPEYGINIAAINLWNYPDMSMKKVVGDHGQTIYTHNVDFFRGSKHFMSICWIITLTLSRKICGT